MSGSRAPDGAAALTALDAARSTASRQSLYLATFVRPTLAESAQYPARAQLVALTAMFLVSRRTAVGAHNVMSDVSGAAEAVSIKRTSRRKRRPNR